MTNFFKYLNIGTMEERWGIYVTTVGHSSILPNQRYPINEKHPQNHSFSWNKGRILNGYYLVFISNGKGVFESALSDPITVTAGTCFFLYPGVWHRYKPHANSGWEEYWVGFKGRYADELMNSGFFDSRKPFIRADHSPELLSSLNRLISAVQGSSPGYQQVIAGITMQILGVLNAVSIAHEEKTGSTEKLVSKARVILEDSADKAVDMDKLVRALPMGYSKFRKAFKTDTGFSPGQYHLNLRLSKAKDLLMSTALNINEVASQTGFASVFYFSKVFKKKEGVSPRGFRKG